MDTNSPRRAPENLESWLRYYKDLGIRSFYRDRANLTAVASATTTLGAEESMPKKKPSAPVPPLAPPAVPQRSATMPGISPIGASQSGAPKIDASRIDVSRIQAIAHGPSLFEAAERIEGDTLERISNDLGDCTRCKLSRHRNKIVFGVGNPHAELVFVGEGPGHDEDVQGIPFVGRAGQLLTQMIVAMGLRREDVYIANVVKCRPPENRTPEKDEVSTCMPFLFRQIAAIEPKVIVCLGNVAAQSMLGTNKGISNYRGQWLEFRGARLMATYHPAYLLRNPNAKPEVWADLKKVMAVLGLKPPRPASSRV